MHTQELDPPATQHSPRSIRAIRIPASGSAVHPVDLKTMVQTADAGGDILLINTIDFWGEDGRKEELAIINKNRPTDPRTGVLLDTVDLYYLLYLEYQGNLRLNQHLSVGSHRVFGDAFLVKVKYDRDDFSKRLGYLDFPDRDRAAKYAELQHCKGVIRCLRQEWPTDTVCLFRYCPNPGANLVSISKE